MWPFSNGKKLDSSSTKTPMSSAEYEFCVKRIAELSGDVKTLTTDVKNLSGDLDILRGKLNQRLGALKKVQEAETEKDKSTANDFIG